MLMDFGYRVLLVDADPQPTLSSYYNLEQRAEHGLQNFLIESAALSSISQTTIENLDIVLSADPNG
ncbi:ParA family protein [Methylomarinum vadi]|uniref:ParA family protein n=1 Tax=Methylomarinum vadi TaxID=438855 RepID=UPI00228677DD|nr:AAA family ATPase [Methylomarinum vadi]